MPDPNVNNPIFEAEPDPNTTFTIPEAEAEAEVEVQQPTDPLYARQAPLGLEAPSVILIGVGGVGCWVALALALGGVEHMTLFDGDTLSLHNLNRFPLPQSSAGEMKSLALAKWLLSMRPEAEITARGEFDPETHGGYRYHDWVVCATDSLGSRKLAYNLAIGMGAKYLEVGADGEQWSLSPSPPEFSTELESQAGYSVTPVHVGPCMMAASAAVYYILHDCIPAVSHSAKWEKGPIIRAYPNLGGIKFRTISEIAPPVFGDMVTCEFCGVRIEDNIITIIKHIREDRPLGLVEAKALAEAWLAKAAGLSLAGGEVEEEEEEVDNGQEV